MANPTGTQQDGRITLRLLILIRWMAIIGQSLAVVIAHYQLNIHLELFSIFLIIGASVLLNVFLWQTQRRHQSNRVLLNDRDAALLLGYDILQLSALLIVTGGLKNPFVIMILGPVMVASTLLSRRGLVILCTLALACLAFMGIYHKPLPWPDGNPFPELYTTGMWIALGGSCFFIALYNWYVARETRRLSQALNAAQLALLRGQKINAMGGLAAAAAHELGSPLSTIALVANELAKEIPKDSPFASDIELLQSQSARCRDILAELARKPETQMTEFDAVPLTTLVEISAAPHQVKNIKLTIINQFSDTQPSVQQTPELIHGLGTILQNAFQFARHNVTVTLKPSQKNGVEIMVQDDGPGFPPGLLSRIGEPYVSARADQEGHMGMGLFIAIALLEQTGAILTFNNTSENGAEVIVHWQNGIVLNPDYKI
jgi:two-component system sensor histidine kinase RegB